MESFKPPLHRHFIQQWKRATPHDPANWHHRSSNNNDMAGNFPLTILLPFIQQHQNELQHWFWNQNLHLNAIPLFYILKPFTAVTKISTATFSPLGSPPVLLPFDSNQPVYPNILIHGCTLWKQLFACTPHSIEPRPYCCLLHFCCQNRNLFLHKNQFISFPYFSGLAVSFLSHLLVLPLSHPVPLLINYIIHMLQFEKKHRANS